MKIRTKLAVVFLSLLSLIIIIVGINYNTYNSLDVDSVFVNYAGRVRAGSYRMAQLSANIVMDSNQNQGLKTELQERIQSMDTLLLSLINGDESMGLLPLENEEIEKEILAIQKEWEEKFKPSYEEIVQSSDAQHLKIINDNIDSYVEQVDAMVSNYAHYSQNKVRTAKTSSIIMIILALIVSVVSGIIIRKGIIAPINLISNEMEEISSGEGDLTKQLKLSGRDEIGKLTKNFNKFVSDIRNIVVSISSSSSVLNESLESISFTSEELAKSTELIAVSVQDVSSGGNEQSEMVNELKTLIDNMKADIDSVINKADMLLQQSEDTKNSAKEGSDTIDKEVSELKLLVENTHEVSDSVNRLQTNSQDIEDILEIITGISDQTNLLALNASIEAARAGETGRGFAVVANEIRKLAEETAQSTVKIGHIVESITEQTLAVKVHMDNMVERINTLEKDINGIQAKLNGIHQKSNETYLESNNIKDINYEIQDNFTTIYHSAGRISEVVENNSENTQEVAAAAEEQTASFEEVSANLSSLNEMSQKMNEIVLKFKV